MDQERTCVITRQALPSDELIRFVASPEGVLVPDIARKLPGRGVWVKASKALFQDAKMLKSLRSKASAQNKQKVTLLYEGDDLILLIEKQLKQQILNRLGLMRAAGQAITGFEKVASAIRGGKLAVWVEASDAQKDGITKLEGLARGLKNKIPVVEAFDRDELSKALGGENIVHAALMDRAQSQRLVNDVLRLLQFEGKALRYVGGED